MKIPGVANLLRHILEDDSDEEDLVKELSAMSADDPGHWEQVGGDYGDPWLYGGDWFNPIKEEAVHFDGIENEKDIEPENVKVPPETMKAIMARVHDPYLDTPEGQEDPAWLQRMLSSEERERDNLVGNYQYARAAFLNDRTPHTFYRFEVTDMIPVYLQRYEEAVRAQFPPGEYDNWPISAKMFEIGRYHGFENMSSSFSMNRIEARKFFGTGSKKLRPDNS